MLSGVAFLVLCFLVTALGGVLAYLGLPGVISREEGWEWGVAVLAGFLFAALVLGALGYKKVSNRQPVLILNQQGVVDCRRAPPLTIPWAHIQGVRLHNTTLQGGDFFATLLVSVSGLGPVELRVDHLSMEANQLFLLVCQFAGLQVPGEVTPEASARPPAPVK